MKIPADINELAERYNRALQDASPLKITQTPSTGEVQIQLEGGSSATRREIKPIIAKLVSSRLPEAQTRFLIKSALLRKEVSLYCDVDTLYHHLGTTESRPLYMAFRLALPGIEKAIEEHNKKTEADLRKILQEIADLAHD